jgi:EmrB/QacA subfamily drug resistance transporter
MAFMKIIFDKVTIIASTTASRRRWIALVVVCLGQLMVVLDSTIVNVALPTIQRELHFSQANLTWVINAFLITFGSFLLLAGRVGDLIGRKRVFLAGLAVFTIASALCGFADSQTTLILARFLQGFGGAMSSSVILAIIVTEFPTTADRAKAMSAYMFVAVAGGSIGLLAGGAITQAISWHWIFFINLPIGALTLLAGALLIDENKGIGLGKGIDVLGSILVTAAMMVGVFAIVGVTQYGWGSAHTLGFGGASLLLGAGFLALESRIANPIMPLRILRIRSLVGSSAVRGCLVTGMFATFFLGALYLQHVLGYSALKTGLAFLPMTICVGTLSLGITARLVRRFGPMKVLFSGLTAVVAGLLLLTQAGVHSGYFPDIFFAYVIVGLGAGTSFMPLLTIAMADVPKPDAGLASGIVNVSMQGSAALGLAVLGTIASSHSKALEAAGSSTASALTAGYHLSFLIGAGCAAVGIVVAFVVLRKHATGPAEQELPADVISDFELEAA